MGYYIENENLCYILCSVSKFDILHHKRKIYYLLQVINSPVAPYKGHKLRILFFEKCNAELFWEYNYDPIVRNYAHTFILLCIFTCKCLHIFRFKIFILVLDKMLIVSVGSSHFQPILIF